MPGSATCLKRWLGKESSRDSASKTLLCERLQLY